jgi:hypothetical protein
MRNIYSSLTSCLNNLDRSGVHVRCLNIHELVHDGHYSILLIKLTLTSVTISMLHQFLSS